MRKHFVSAMVVAAMLATAGPFGPPAARAGQSEWATAGKILAGAVGAVVLGEILRPDCRDTVVVAHAIPPPREEVWVEQPCPIVRARPIAVRGRRAPGHYEWRRERVWRPGQWHTEVRQSWCDGRWIEVRERTWEPGRWVTHRERVWVRGRHASW